MSNINRLAFSNIGISIGWAGTLVACLSGMITSFKVRSIFKQAANPNMKRRANRLLYGKLVKALRDAKLSEALSDSVLREFDRVVHNRYRQH